MRKRLGIMLVDLGSVWGPEECKSECLWVGEGIYIYI